MVAKMDVVNSNVGGVGQASHSFNYNLQNRVKKGQERKRRDNNKIRSRKSVV